MNHADIVVGSWDDNATCSVEDYFNDSDFEKYPRLDTSIGGACAALQTCDCLSGAGRLAMDPPIV